MLAIACSCNPLDSGAPDLRPSVEAVERPERSMTTRPVWQEQFP
jgi:hypothetical protein